MHCAQEALCPQTLSKILSHSVSHEKTKIEYVILGLMFSCHERSSFICDGIVPWKNGAQGC